MKTERLRRPLRCVTHTNPRTASDSIRFDVSRCGGFDKEAAIGGQIEPVEASVDLERLADFRRTGTQIGRSQCRAAPGGLSMAHHGLKAFEGLKRPQQHGDRLAGFAADHVHAVVHAVREVHVGQPGPSVHRFVSRRAATAKGVRRFVLSAEVRLRLDDDAAQSLAVIQRSNKDRPEQRLRERHGIAREIASAESLVALRRRSPHAYACSPGKSRFTPKYVQSMTMNPATESHAVMRPRLPPLANRRWITMR